MVSKISSKEDDTYINNFIGQHGEFKAIEKLKNMGKSAELLESRTHKDNDIIESDGTLWSVKSYSIDNIYSLKNEINDSNAKNYILNAEAYEELKSSGDIQALESKGMQFLNGDFSHEERSLGKILLKK